MAYRALFALLAVLFGLLKICVGGAIFVLPPSAISASPPLEFLVGTDETAAGRCVELAIVSYGLYSLLHGLAFFGIALLVTSWVTSKPMQLLVHGVLGAVLTTFYALVLYTDVPIPKQSSSRSRSRYLMFGLNSGLVFALTAVVLRLQHLHSDVFLRDPETWALAAVAATLLALIVFCVRLPALSRSHKARRTHGSDLATLAFIPLTTMW